MLANKVKKIAFFNAYVYLAKHMVIYGRFVKRGACQKVFCLIGGELN